MQLIVTVKLLNKRSLIPQRLPDAANIAGVVKEGFSFEGVLVDSPNPNMGIWYQDRDGYYYWGGGVAELAESIPMLSSEDFFESTSPLDVADSKLGWGMQKLKIKDFWDEANNHGEQITIAILDTGISSSHPEFDFNRITRFSVLNQDLIAEDINGHGTHIAGIIAAQGKTIMGAAPECNLLIIKIADKSSAWQIENVIEGIQYAITQHVDIISISGEFDKGNSKLPLLKNRIEEADAKGIIVVASAGNNFNSFPVNNYPAAFDQCISVGSIKQDGSRADSSSHSTKLAVVAPGEIIISTWLDGTYKEESGTSMAAPLVAGVIAVLKSYARVNFQRNLSPAEVKLILCKSADDAGDVGHDTSYGFGIINPIKALRMLKH